MKPLALDLCCGLGGWADGLLAEGWDVIGYDIERHDYGTGAYPGQLVIQDIRTLDGSQFRGKVSLAVASPPCTEFSYMAMPWRRGKRIATALRGKGEFPEGYKGSRTIAQLTELFDACVRIGRQAGCPTVIENVRGAQSWIGKARWNFGSYYLFGDVPALMPITQRSLSQKLPVGNTTSAMWSERPIQRLCDALKPIDGFKTQGMNWSDRSIKGQDFTRIAGQQAEDHINGVKNGGDAFSDPKWGARVSSHKSKARKAASATIAKIPLPLARWIAKVYYPKLQNP